jgi:hypothetical protein
MAICLVGLAVSTLEFLVIARSFAPEGVYSWPILRLHYESGPGSFAVGMLRPIQGSAGVRAFLLARLAVILALFAAQPGGAALSALMALLVLSNMLFTMRRAIGDDGSDQMNSIILTTVLVCVTPLNDGFSLTCGVWFLAAQAALSYAVAGIAKLVSPVWRSGDAIYLVFNTCTYGNRWVAGVVRQRRWLRLVLCWSVILVESLFPLAFVLPHPFLWFFLIAAGLFHLGCAVIMGLNSFFFAFTATYPAVYYVAVQMSPAIWG